MKFDPEYLKLTAIQQQVSALKRKSYGVMKIGSGSTALDLGCGPGIDTIALAKVVGSTGKIVGVDSDPIMINEAEVAAQINGTSKWTEHKTCDVTTLPFHDESFDACRCERVTQHLFYEDSLRVVQEAKRVLRSTGRIVFLDTDWASLSVHSKNPVIERYLTSVCTLSWENGFAARSLPEIFSKSGLKNILVDVTSIRLSLTEIVNFIEPMLGEFPGYSPYSTQDIEGWLQSLRDQEMAGTFLATVNMVLCHGTKI